MDDFDRTAADLLIATLVPEMRRGLRDCLQAGATIPEVDGYLRRGGVGPLLRLAALVYCYKWLKRLAIRRCRAEE